MRFSFFWLFLSAPAGRNRTNRLDASDISDKTVESNGVRITEDIHTRFSDKQGISGIERHNFQLINELGTFFPS
jgi:hypothetical protein